MNVPPKFVRALSLVASIRNRVKNIKVGNTFKSAQIEYWLYVVYVEIMSFSNKNSDIYMYKTYQAEKWRV